MKLTKAAIARLALAPGKAEALTFDDDLPGFGIRLRQGGKRTWIVQYRLGTKQRRLTLGSVEVLDADEARRRARNALAKVQLGTDPQTEKADVRAQAAVTLGQVADDYLTRTARNKLKPKSFQDARRYLKSHFAGLRETPIQKVQRAQVAVELGRIATENGPYASNRARAALSRLFSWAIGEGITDSNPTMGTNKATVEVSRDRVLSDVEIALAWRLAGSGDYSAIVRLAFLTGQRREEIGGMLWSELDIAGAVWNIGAERTKNGLPHAVPLSATSLELLNSLTRQEDRDLVFGSGNGPYQGWSNAKIALDQRMKLAIVDLEESKKPFLPWRFHDIRRTVATRLGDIGVQPHVVEAILNHISGTKAGVAGVYNRAVYSREKRAALESWARTLKAIVQT